MAKDSHFSFAYSALACFRMGISGSASFQSARKSRSRLSFGTDPIALTLCLAAIDPCGPDAPYRRFMRRSKS